MIRKHAISLTCVLAGSIAMVAFLFAGVKTPAKICLYYSLLGAIPWIWGLISETAQAHDSRHTGISMYITMLVSLPDAAIFLFSCIYAFNSMVSIILFVAVLIGVCSVLLSIINRHSKTD